MKRIAGFFLIIIAVLSLLLTVYGSIQVWGMRVPLADAADAGIDLFAKTLDTTSEALRVVSDTLQSTSDTITTLEETTLSVAETMSTTRTTVSSFAVFMGKDLPASVKATRTALISAQSSAVVVESVMTTLSSVPLINVQYNPAVPLDVALGDVARSLDNLPPIFIGAETDLNATSDSLAQVAVSLRQLPGTAQQLQRNIADARRVVALYEGQVTGLVRLTKLVRSSLASALVPMELAVAFLIFWLGTTQVMALLKGLELLRGERNRNG